MAFYNEIFPETISEASRFGVNYKNSVVQTGTGRIEVVEQWDPAGRTRFDVSTGIRSASEASAFLHFFRMTRGSANTFLFWDATDFSTGPNDIGDAASNDVQLGIGDGAETRFQLVKNYTYGGTYVSPRTIQYPDTSTLLVSIDGVTQSSGWSWDGNTFEVVFSTAPALNEVVAAGCGKFYNRVRFDPQTDLDFMRFRRHLDGGVDTPIFLLEDRDGTRSPEEMYLGGGTDFGSIDADVYLTSDDGLAISVDPSTTGLSVYLPPISDFSAGGPWHHVTNDSGTNSFTLRDYDGVSLGTVAANGQILLSVRISSGANAWQGSVIA